MIPHFKKVGKRSGRMPGHGDDANRRVARRHSHAVISHLVPLRFSAGMSRRLIDRIPVCDPVDKMRARYLVLQEFRPAVVVGVSVRQQNVF